jgi:predicted Fe-Mo cluster-binding NifX family protein
LPATVAKSEKFFLMKKETNEEREVYMRIAFASEDKLGLKGEVSAHFGRCPYYTFLEVDGNEVKNWQVIDNPYHDNHVPGKVPEFIHSQKADVMIAGGMGPRAIEFFDGFGIEAVTGAFGRIEDVLAAYLSGELRGAGACKHDHEESCGH